MNKPYFSLIAAMWLLTPGAAYSQPATDMKGHTHTDRSKADTYSDTTMEQPMTDMKDMKSDKMMDKSKTGLKSKKKTGKAITGTKSKNRMSKPMKDSKSDQMMDKPMTQMPPENIPENK